MNRAKFMESLKKDSIKKEITEQLISVYGEYVPEEIIKILSLYSTPILFNEKEYRTLSLNEVLHAEEDNNIPFKSKKIIPIIDCGNNDIIAYNGNQKVWCMYNILDEIIFNEENSFEKLFLE